MAKRIPVSLIVVVLIFSLSIVVKWSRERRPPLSTARMVANNRGEAFCHGDEALESIDGQKANDCDGWAHMSSGQKQAKDLSWTICISRVRPGR